MNPPPSPSRETPTLTALFLVLPEIEEFARPYRQLHTPDGAAGLPAHITLLCPFVPGAEENAEVRQKLATVAALLHPFSLDLSRLDIFPEPRVLFLDPIPREPILAMIRVIMDAFPGVKPYDGVIPIEELRPHATLAVCPDNAQMNSLKADIRAKLPTFAPLLALVDAVYLAARIDGEWRILSRYAFAAVGI